MTKTYQERETARRANLTAVIEAACRPASTAAQGIIARPAPPQPAASRAPAPLAAPAVHVPPHLSAPARALPSPVASTPAAAPIATPASNPAAGSSRLFASHAEIADKADAYLADRSGEAGHAPAPELPSTRDASGKLSTDGIYARRAASTKPGKGKSKPAAGTSAAAIYARRAGR